MARMSMNFTKIYVYRSTLEKVFPLLKHNSIGGMKDELNKVICAGDDGTDEEVLDKPGIVKQFVAYNSNEKNLVLMNKCIFHLEVSEACHGVNGPFCGIKDEGYFSGNRTVRWIGERDPLYSAIKYTS